MVTSGGTSWQAHGEGTLTASTRIRGLECKLGHGRIVLPADAIDLLGEYAVGARLPVNERVECAIGVWAGDPIVSISLSQHVATVSRLVHGALLVGGRGGIRWALEIDQPVGLVEIEQLAPAPPTMPWRRAATLSDQRSAQYIDVKQMIATFEGGAT